MKTTLTLTAFLFTLISYSQTQFCNGWKEGYKQGYCYGNYGCVTPVTPPCPIPNIGNDNYQGGYNQGFVSGKSAKNNEGNSSTGGAYGQLRPLQNTDIGSMVSQHIREEQQAKQNTKYETQRAYNDSMQKGLDAYFNENYSLCVFYFEQSKQYNMYDNRFGLAAGISYYFIWLSTKDIHYYNKSVETVKISIGHGNKEAIKVLEQIENE